MVATKCAMISMVCACCERTFGVCTSCFRGTRRCSTECTRARRKRTVRAADRRYRCTARGLAMRRDQAKRRYMRRKKSAASVDFLGDPSRDSAGAGDDRDVDRADVPPVTSMPEPEVSYAASSSPSPSALSSTPAGTLRCIRCGHHSAWRISLSDHLATRERARADWLDERRPRRPQYGGRSP